MNSRFLVFVGVIQAILFFGHALIYFALKTFLQIPDGPPTTTLQISLAILSISFVAATVISFRTDHPVARWFYNVAAIWLGLLHLLLFMSILELPWFLIAKQPPSVFALGYGVALLVGVFGWIRTRFPGITHVTLKLPNLPESWRHQRIVWISDVHLGHINGHRFAGRIVRKINRLEPDLVFVGGDLFDGGKVDVERVTRPFNDLKAKQGTLFITGNHELFTGDTRFVEAVRKVGMKVLDDQITDIDGLQIVGVDYHSSRSPKKLRSVLQSADLDPNRSSILLTHSPDRLEIAEQAGISLQISGHTHQGQMWPFSLITRSVYHGYDYGLKPLGTMLVYTSSGTGTWGPPIRFRTRSEIVCITLN